ncbi:MAG: hypothetical protein ABIQ61_09650 [Ornithinibacter sp.]
MTAVPSRRTRVTLAWVGAVLVTALNGALVGYGAIWLQFFGDSPDAGDYLLSAGGYGAAAAVLAFAVAAMLTHDGPRWLAWQTVALSCALALMATSSAIRAAQEEPSSSTTDTVWDGIGGVLWGPWTWALVLLGLHGAHRLAVGSGRHADRR